MSTRPLEERFWEKVDKRGPDECWEWKASKNTQGYGQIGAGGRGNITLAHRVGYEIEHGKIPNGLHCLHHCDNPSCVNPAHLFLGTPADNMHDRDAKGRGRTIPLPGEKNGRHKLTEAQVREIRNLKGSGVSAQDLSGVYGVTKAMIHFIVSRKSWSCVE